MILVFIITKTPNTKQQGEENGKKNPNRSTQTRKQYWLSIFMKDITTRKQYWFSLELINKENSIGFLKESNVSFPLINLAHYKVK